MFRSLKYRNFRLFFVGQFVSLCGTWMQSTAQYWLVYRLTKDPFMLGLTAVAGQFPVFLLGPFAGSQIDRRDHLRMVQLTQTMAMLQACAMAALAWSNRATAWHVIGLALLLGVVNAFDIPARQCLIGELVEAEHRHNAIALNSTIVNGSRIVGPALAGLAIGWLGEAWCFGLNAASFVAVLAALFQMKAVRRPAAAASAQSLWQETREGLAYAAGRAPIRILLFVLATYTVVGTPVYILQPVFADAVLHAGARGLGWLSAMAGVGASIGALHLAGRRSARGLGSVMIRCLLVFSACLVGLALSRDLRLSCLLFAAIGWAAIQILSGANTLLQELSSDEFRGRVMSFYAMIFVGMAPLGSFLAGALASRFGAPRTVFGQALLCLALTARDFRRLPAALAAEGPGEEGPKDPFAVSRPAITSL